MSKGGEHPSFSVFCPTHCFPFNFRFYLIPCRSNAPQKNMPVAQMVVATHINLSGSVLLSSFNSFNNPTLSLSSRRGSPRVDWLTMDSLTDLAEEFH